MAYKSNPDTKVVRLTITFLKTIAKINRSRKRNIALAEAAERLIQKLSESPQPQPQS